MKEENLESNEPQEPHDILTRMNLKHIVIVPNIKFKQIYNNVYNSQNVQQPYI